MTDPEIQPDFKLVIGGEEREQQTFEGHAFEAYCVDCPETYSGTLKQCHDWLEKHRKETGHRG